VSLLDLTQYCVEQARRGGATDSECTILEGSEFSVTVRMREVEQLKEAGSRAAGIRVLIGQRAGSAYTSDLTTEGLDRMVASALANAQLTTDDPHAGLPDAQEFGQLTGDLNLYSDSIDSLDAARKIEYAKRTEAAALDFDPRIINSEGGSFESGVGARYFANSRGFAGSYRTSNCSLVAVPVARDAGSNGDGPGRMERDYWYTSARNPDQLDSPESVGRIAAERTLRRLGARKVPTQKAAVVFEPRMAQRLIGEIFGAVSGDSVYRNASFLAGKLGERIASENVTIIDDGTIPGLWGTSPFDDEGVPSRRTVVVEKGVLKSYLLNTYTARKLGLKTTGNASRALSGAPSVGNGNFYLEPGALTAEAILRQAGTGLYVTEMLGHGVNIVNGDFSQGAAGLWIENGELAYPVAEVTIASTLQAMLNSIVAIGNDLEWRTSVAAPTILIEEMTISGS
jgi:PmbA protein